MKGFYLRGGDFHLLNQLRAILLWVICATEQYIACLHFACTQSHLLTGRPRADCISVVLFARLHGNKEKRSQAERGMSHQSQIRLDKGGLCCGFDSFSSELFSEALFRFNKAKEENEGRKRWKNCNFRKC